MEVKDFTKDFEKKDIDSNKGMACLSYLGILALIPFFASKNSKYAQWHAKQGLNLLIVEIIFGIISVILQSVIKVTTCSYIYCYTVTPWYVVLPLSLINICFTVLSIMGLVYALQGKAKELPLVNKIKIIK